MTNFVSKLLLFYYQRRNLSEKCSNRNDSNYMWKKYVVKTQNEKMELIFDFPSRLFVKVVGGASANFISHHAREVLTYSFRECFKCNLNRFVILTFFKSVHELKVFLFCFISS